MPRPSVFTVFLFSFNLKTYSKIRSPNLRYNKGLVSYCEGKQNAKRNMDLGNINAAQLKLKIGEVSCSHGRFHGMVQSYRLTQPTTRPHFPISDARRDLPAQTKKKIDCLLVVLINKPNPVHRFLSNLENQVRIE